MSEPLSQKFSLYSWLLKKLRKELIIWYFFTFLSSFFYYQATQGLKIWGHKGRGEWEYSVLFGTISFKTRGGLLLYAFFCFFVGYLLTSLVCEQLKNYTLELCRKLLRKLLINYSSQNLSQTRLHNREILNNFLGETELFVPLFILVPQRIYSAIINIILTLIFVVSFKENDFANFTISFVIVASLILAFLSFLAYQVQKKINQKQNQLRQQENLAAEKYLEKPTSSPEVEKLISVNFQKNRALIKKKTLSYLLNLIIPGLGILFCLVYIISKNGWGNWEIYDIKELVSVGVIAGSIQTIFWKVREVADNSPEISKTKVHYNSLQKILSKLQKGSKKDRSLLEKKKR